jgi:hypothetical protein
MKDLMGSRCPELTDEDSSRESVPAPRWLLRPGLRIVGRPVSSSASRDSTDDALCLHGTKPRDGEDMAGAKLSGDNVQAKKKSQKFYDATGTVGTWRV